jgi:hypothetical protein
MTPKPLYSLDQLRTMSGGNEAFVQKMIELFFVVVEPSLQALNVGVEQKDYKALFSHAHKIKSNIRHFEIWSILDDVIFIEHQAKEEKSMEEISVRMVKVNEVLDQVIIDLKSGLNAV